MAKPIPIPSLDAREFDRLADMQATPLQAAVAKQSIRACKKRKKK